MGFSSYFLVVADICKYARDNGIPVGPGRGSATGLDRRLRHPHHELDAARAWVCCSSVFLNPERISPPDESTSTSTTASATGLVRYVTEKYGSEMTAQVNTFGTIKAKAAVKDAARILGYPFVVGDKITKAMTAAA
ncbi:hypothetical protein [Nonomuraea dietziae]|uniref:hypothetical protein n=1 Tax=Nonomuraea dietziae TaxID=65515 RepID=UPI003CD092C2